MAPSAAPLEQVVSASFEQKRLLLLADIGNSFKEGSFNTCSDLPSNSESGRGPLRRSQSTGALSSVSSHSSNFSEMSKEERKDAKLVVKHFVRGMVKGRTLSAVLSDGSLRPCFCMLTRKLDMFRIKANKTDTQARDIPLRCIEEIVVGSSDFHGVCEGLDTPVDEFCATMAIRGQSGHKFISFRLSDKEALDAFVLCLTMLSQGARDGGKGGA